MAAFDVISGAGECYGGGDVSFSTTATYMYLGGVPGGNTVAAWMPFTMPLPRGIQILGATLHLTSTQTNPDLIHIRVGCEAADNPSTPTSSSDVRNRVLTAAYNVYNPENYSAGVTYTFDLTAAVQEVVNRAGWAYNNTLAALITRQSAGDP